MSRWTNSPDFYLEEILQITKALRGRRALVYPKVCILRIHLFLKMRYYGKHTAQDLAIQPLRLKFVISDKNHSLVAARKCNRRRTRASKLTLFVQDDVSLHHLVHGNCNCRPCQKMKQETNTSIENLVELATASAVILLHLAKSN